MFMNWFDPDPKKPLVEKMAEGAARYRSKRGVAPTFCLLSQQDYDTLAALVASRADLPDLQMDVETERYVRPNVFMIGQESDHVPT